MIDRKSRNILAETLRQYVSGRITNDDLADCNIKFKDRGVRAISEMAWLQLYDDLYNHRAVGKHYIGGEARDIVSRWICFLHTDLEYEWPEFCFIQTYNLPMNILTFGWWEKRKEQKFKEFMSYGDFKYWPFMNKEAYDQTMKQPHLLSKHNGN
jgi:hypothetical protein